MEDKHRIECVMHRKRDVYNKEDIFVIMGHEEEDSNVGKVTASADAQLSVEAEDAKIDQSMAHFLRDETARLNDVREIQENKLLQKYHGLPVEEIQKRLKAFHQKQKKE